MGGVRRWSGVGWLLTASLVAAGCTNGADPAARPSIAGRPVSTPAARPAPPEPGLVWTPQRLPVGLVERVRSLPGVAAALAVANGTLWLTDTAPATGGPGPRPATGAAVPLDVSAAEPAAYARLVPGAGAVAALRPGTAVLGATSAALRSLGPGAVLGFGSVRLRVQAVAPDAAVGYAELFVTPADAARLGLAGPRYLLVGARDRGGWASLAADIRGLLPASTPVRLRAPGQARWLREGDAVLPPVLEKVRFGEFTVGRGPGGDGGLATDPAWQRRHIGTATVPLLGRVTCNQAILGPLRAALGDLQRSGLGALVRRRDYGGCYVPRLIPGLPGAAISHHAWGSAIDINVSANPIGGRPRQDPRLVAAFARHGFAWGGDWLVPDGMHFDWLGGT